MLERRTFATLVTLALLQAAAARGASPSSGFAPPANPVRASSIHSDAYLPDHALDGDPQTRWASRPYQNRPEWLQLDFGRSVAIDRLTLHWEAAYAVDYQIRVSDDGQHWRTAREVTGSHGGRESLEGLAARGRYLRVECLAPSRFQLFSIWELEFPEKAVSAALAEVRRQALAAAHPTGPDALRRAAELLGEHGVEEIVYALRQPGKDGHWYANFGYYAPDENRTTYGDGGKLCRMHVASGRVTALLDDPRGGVRDPAVHYDAGKILFSYRKGGTPYYHLYEIDVDGGNLRQLTDGPFDDIEPCYLPDGRIAFVSSRCKRWVNCWLTQVAVLHRCEADGSNIEPISANLEHDNTPWPLPDGRLLYQRWEYVDRSQVDYHHLWTANPDGTGQTVFFGNQRPGTVMIDARPIPRSDKVVAIFSPGHGQREHDGVVTIVDPRLGPEAAGAARPLTSSRNYRDPWAFTEELVLAGRGQQIVLLDGSGYEYELYRTDPAEQADGLQCHEPRPLVRRERERVIPDRTAPGRATGTLVLLDVYRGRQMADVPRGDVRRLLVVEALPKPINYTGGMDPLTYGGSFTLERVLGTVPVEADGSASLEVPAQRAVFFIALDENDLAIKRMRSFASVQPGEVTGCVGCHESRTGTLMPDGAAAALRRRPSKIEPIADCPDVFDFPRDIQPILDRLCVDCHGTEETDRGGPYAGGVLLTGDHGPMFSHAYFTMTVRRLFSDNRNEARSNDPPRAYGSAASRILTMLDGSHHGVEADAQQRKMLRLWIDLGAPYPGTYAALGCGAIGGYTQNTQHNVDTDWPTTRAGAEAIDRRCAACHQGDDILPRSLSDERDISFWRFSLDDPRLKLSRHIVFNLSRPERSLLLLAPLARSAGGLELCKADGTASAVFADTSDADYQTLLAMVEAGRENLAAIKRFDMPGFQPLPQYLREMRRYGILPHDHPDDAPVDPYALDRRYWQSLGAE